MRKTTMRRTLAATVAMIGIGVLVLAGCSGGNEGGGTASGTPTVVTSTNVWAAVASAVAGEDASVTALYTNAEGDPHEFEPSASDTAEVADADVVVLNGGHYDAYMESAAKGSDATIIDAFAIMTGDDHATANEHVFYDLAVVGKVATQIGDALAEKDPTNAETFKANAAAFNTEIDGLRAQVASIKQAHDGTKVAQTEPLAGYLLSDAGLVDVAPTGFTGAVEEGQSPSASDRAQMEDLLTSGTVHALIYNTQAVDSTTEALLATANDSGVAVVDFTETLPEGTNDYIEWQRAQIEALSAALNNNGAH
ncbi:putative ABC transporter substrate-binding protein [Gordonia rhizosphera NBRC 16068]|uniref:Putative ABC transporter substrate-binding protein n=2 Tax=Gordonia rhizosphera TaxID=83341 RepID=K6WHT1_9ACTN|nr:putative ABC transporter substrate-binding protein [Gordonia rhizosphera NBRC 16068]